jgi:hypothetical protein
MENKQQIGVLLDADVYLGVKMYCLKNKCTMKELMPTLVSIGIKTMPGMEEFIDVSKL